MPYVDAASDGPVDLEVVILNWNGRDLVRECLRSFLDRPPRVATRVTVVDNASSDGSAAMLRREFGGRVRLIESPENAGFARGNNLALAATRARYALLLNSDTTLPPDATAHPWDLLVEAMDARPRAGALGPRLVSPAGVVEDSTGDRVGLLSIAKNRVLRLLRLPRALSGLVSDQLCRRDREREVAWATAAALIVRGEIVRDGCLLDEGYFMYTEDVEWCHRIRARGWSIVYWPGVTIVHRGHGSDPAPADRARRRRLHREGLLRFIRLHPWPGCGILRAVLLRSLKGG